MKLTGLIVASAMGLATLASGNANAAVTGADAVMSGSLSALSCAAFTHYSPKHRDSLVAQITGGANMKAVQTSVTIPHVGRHTTNGKDSQTVAGTPLTSAMIVSACQAASPNATVGAALHAANSGGGQAHTNNSH